ncbi:MAG: hypothetical protein C4330_01135 [Chitinophagaceae bacterium]
MKKMLVSAVILLTSTLSYAQSHEGTVTSLKKLQPAAVIELNYPPAVVEDALNDYLSKKGRSKVGDIKGFTTYRNTQPVTNDSVNADLYFKIERKSRKEKHLTTVSMLLTAPDENATATNLHYMNMQEAKDYLNGLVQTISSYDLEQKIKEQNVVLTKTENKYKNLVIDGQNLQKKKIALDKNIAENSQEQQALSAEVESQKQILATMVGKRN